MVLVSGFRGAAMALLCSAMLSSSAWGAVTQQPTPHQRLDRALAPVQQVIDELRVTEDERHALRDWLQRAEALAAEQVECTQRGELLRAQAAERAIVLVARVIRGHIEAVRAESIASEREQQATEAEASARQSRGALERAVERRLTIEREAERAPQEPQALQAPNSSSSQPPTRPSSARPAGARRTTAGAR